MGCLAPCRGRPLLAKQIRPAVTDAPAHPLRGSHAAQDDLEAVRAPAGFEAFLESALDEAIDKVDHAGLAFGPEFGHLLGAFSGNGLFTRLRRRTGLVLCRRWCGGDESEQRELRKDPDKPGPDNCVAQDLAVRRLRGVGMCYRKKHRLASRRRK